MARTGEAIAHNLARQDVLTGLGNRLCFIEQAEALFAGEKGGTSAGLLLIDVDRFKRVNDTYGHDVGDLVLRRIADILRTAARPGDTVARMGGEEFVMLAPGLSGPALVALAQKVRIAVRNHPQDDLGDGAGPITVSIGVAEGEEEQGYETLYRIADQALYRAKQSGRDRVEVAPPSRFAAPLKSAPTGDGERSAPGHGSPTREGMRALP